MLPIKENQFVTSILFPFSRDYTIKIVFLSIDMQLHETRTSNRIKLKLIPYETEIIYHSRTIKSILGR